jgi:YD repeat-containing protein
VNYTYDGLNRVLTEDYTGSGGTEATYSYDSGTDGKTRLTQAVMTGSATTDYAYNPLGLTKTETKAITGGGTYTTTYDYDRQGNQTKITYPDNAEVQYAYNSAGLLETVTKKESGESSYSNVVTDFDYAPTGQVSFTANANGTETTNTYDPAELYRLKTKLTKLSSCTACGGEEAPEGWLPPEFMVLAEQAAAPLKEVVSFVEGAAQPILPEATSTPTLAPQVPTAEGSKIPTTMPPQSASTYEQKKSAYIQRKKDLTVTVGDARSDDFSPKATLSRWGEASLEVSLPSESAKAKQPATFTNNKIAWNDGEREVRFYELPESSEVPEGGYEIDIVYPKRPASNVITMNIASQGLDFFYQPPLNKEILSDESVRCTETACVDAKGTIVAERPENVVGSYAVYYADGIAGDASVTRHNNYKAGKAFHIYRPKITDAAGNSVWGTLDIDKGVLTVKVPQNFLNTAEYPITVDPTFGYTTAGASSADTGAAAGSKYSMPEDGTVTQISVYTKATTGTINTGAAMYSDSSGAPNALLTSHTSTPSQGTTASWVDVPVTSYAATSGTNYWLWGWSSASRTVYWDSGSTNQYNIQGMTWPVWNNPITPGTYFARKTSIYATYTASSPATTTADILQKFIYTYDANGNITNITDNSKTGTGKTANFAYDPLNRLTSASTTVATSTSYTHSYTYSPIGNISSSTPAGSYLYAGTNYANPHAATSIGGVTHAYDNNGNLTAASPCTHSWNYRNNLTQSGNGTATSTFAYDHAGERVLKTEAGVTTAFPNKFYNTTSTTTTKHIFANGVPIATITSGVAASGIALDTTSSIIHGGYTSGPTTKNWTHTTSGSNRLLVLSADIWQDVPGTGTITSASWNGGAFTKATSTRGGGMASEIWYLVASTTGAKTMSVTITGDTDAIKLAASSFTGALQSSPLDTTSIASGFGGNPTMSLTTGTANDLVAATLSRFGITAATTNRTSLYNSTASSTLGAASYQIATAAGSYSDTYTGSASADWSMVMAGFKPATGGTGSTTMYYDNKIRSTSSSEIWSFVRS